MSDAEQDQAQPKRGPNTIDSALDREVGQQGAERRREDVQEVKVDGDGDQAGQAPRAGGYGTPEFAADGDSETLVERTPEATSIEDVQVDARTVSLDGAPADNGGAESRRGSSNSAPSGNSEDESPAPINAASPAEEGATDDATPGASRTFASDAERAGPAFPQGESEIPNGSFIPVELDDTSGDEEAATSAPSSPTEDNEAPPAAAADQDTQGAPEAAASDTTAVSDGASAPDEAGENAARGDEEAATSAPPAPTEDNEAPPAAAAGQDTQDAPEAAAGNTTAISDGASAPGEVGENAAQGDQEAATSASSSQTENNEQPPAAAAADTTVIADGASATNEVGENAAQGDRVGIVATAPGNEDAPVTFSLADDAGGRFAIASATGEVTVAAPELLDFESAQSHEIVVEATSPNGAVSTQSFVIQVTDHDEFDLSPVVDGDAAQDGITENANVGDTVGVAVSAVDEDGSDNAVQYSLSENPNGAFAIDASSGVVTVADPAGIDFETSPSMQIEVTATAQDGSTSTQRFDIAVDDVNEYSVTPAGDTDDAPNLVSENARVGDLVGVAAAAEDADGTDAVSYSLTGNPNDAFAIDSETGVVSVADPAGIDFESASSMQIEVTATSADGSTSTQTFEIAVTDENEFDITATADRDAGSDTVAENAAAGDRVGVTAFASDADGSSSGVEYSLSENPNDAFAIDPVTGEVTVADPAALDFESAQSMQIEVTATSQDGSTSSQSFDIAVTDSDEFDVSAVEDNNGVANTVAENAAVGDSIGVTAFAADADGTNNGVEYSLSENPNDAFAIDPVTGEVTVADPAGLDFESTQSMQIEVTATSQDGSTSAQTFDIAVTDSDEFNVSPVEDNDGLANSVAENADEGDSVGVTAFASDADGTNNGVEYSLSENPNDAFAIDPNTGEVTVADPAGLDFESAQSMQIEVTATSQDGSTSAQSFDIAVTDSDEFDVSSVEDNDGVANTIGENAAVGDPIGVTAFAADADGTNNGVEYSLSENPNEAFAIDPVTGEVTVADPAGLDFESAQSMQIEVTATSQDGSTSTQTFDIAVSDSDEFDVSAVSDADRVANTIAESATVGETVGVTAFASDTDGTNSGVEYSLSANPNDAFAIDPVTGEVTVADPEGLDFESAQSMQIEVTATSQDGSTSTQTFDIAITDSDEFDVSAVADNDGLANSVAENAGVGDSVGVTAFASDADGTSSGVEYSLSENPNDAFAIDPVTGEVTVAAPSGLDFESAQSMQIEVTATSQDGSTSTQTFDIAITDSDEFDISPVSDDDGAANTVAETALAGDSVGVTAFATDADGTSNAVEYSLSENPNDAFAIDSVTGEVTVADPDGLDFESAESMQIEVTATSQDGSSSTQTFDIAITDGNEFDVSAVSDADGAANTVAENASAGDSVGVTAFAADADGTNNGVEYTLSDNPNDAFAIDPQTGEVTVADPTGLDFESAQSMQIEVTATSQDGSTSTQIFDVEVSDIDEFDTSAVSDTDGTASVIAEGASNGTTVGITAFASDADGATNEVSYSLSSNPDDAFAIDASTGVVTVNDTTALDFEASDTMQIEVTATSTDGSSSTQTFDITLTDDDEFDVSAVADTDGAANFVSENATAGDTVGVTAFAADGDGTNNGVSYSLSDDAGGAFTIDAESGEVTVADPSAIDYELNASMQIEVTATSQDGSTSAQSFTIDVGNESEGLFTVTAQTETFDDGASGWSNDITTGEGDSAFGAFLGRFGAADGEQATTKDFGVADDAEYVTVTFDFYEIDSWDAGYWSRDAGVETFIVDINGETVLNETFTHESSSRPTDVDREGGADGVTYTIDSEESVQMGYSGWADQVHEITITLEAPEDGVMALAFGSTLHQSLRDESYGIDNIRVQSFDANGNEMLVIEEGAEGGEVVGVLAAADNADGSVTYELTDADSPFEIVDGKLQVKDGATLDYEAQSSYDVEVVATNESGQVESQTLTVHVADQTGLADTAGEGAIVDSDGAQNTIDVTHVASGVPDSLPIDIEVPASQVEGSQLHFVIEGVPEGATLSAGHAQGDGTWLVSADEAGDLTLSPPQGSAGIELSITPVEVSAGGDNLLVNGSFESESVNDWTTVTELEGWETVGRTELWESGFSGTEASDGDVSIELDANRGGAEGIYQNVDLAEGEVHQVSFDLRARPNTSDDTNTVEVYWNGELVMEVTPDSTEWETITFEVTGSDGTDQLMFMESSEDSDSYGAHIDNVSLVQLDVEHEHPAQAFVWEEQDGVAAGDSVGITAAPSDGDDAGVTYSLADNPNDAFAIDAETGEVTVADADAVRELGGSTVELEVTATSADGDTATQGFSIDVTRDSDANETFTGGAGDDAVDGAGGDDLYQFFAMDTGTNSFDGGTGWDAVALEVPAGSDDTPWTIEVDGQTIDYDLDAGTIDLDADSSGTITYEDGSQLEFERLDNIFW
ncbi:MAG: cadherin domain-containing protein [Pseudomonadota bacterium]